MFDTDKALNVSIVVMVVIVAISVLHHEFAAKPAQPLADPELAPPAMMPEWAELQKGGRMLTKGGEPVVIAEFTDYQCPYCRNFDSLAATIIQRYDGQVGRRVFDFPLTQIHPYAFAAAQSAACAAEQGKFRQLHDVLFANQARLAQLSTDSLATMAGVPILAKFRSCVADPRSRSSVEHDVVVARGLGVRQTPTVIINGWRFASTPSEAILTATIKALLAGKRPPGVLQ